MVKKSEPQGLWSASYGITSNDQIPLFFTSSHSSNSSSSAILVQAKAKAKPKIKVKKIRSSSQPTSSDLVIGWGTKPNTQPAITFSIKNDLDYICLEDGFISYLGHPSEDSMRLSLIKDDIGIYYDATRASRLEQLLAQSTSKNSTPQIFSEQQQVRAKQLIASITTHGISKYNHSRKALPQSLQQLGNDCILLVDQTAGDQSIEKGLASAESFQQMLKSAIAAHPNKPIIIKTHPDTLISGQGSKKGHFNASKLPADVTLLTEDCLIPELMTKVSDIYVVTSQLGFEALLYGKHVHCFGMPFYAGWGLTHDKLVCERRTAKLTLPQLVYSSLIQYPTYLNPETQQICQVEQIVDWLALQLDGQGSQRTAVDICYAFGFSLWKRAFVKQFIGRLADNVIFINDTEKLEALLKNANSLCSVLLWGRGKTDWANKLKQSTEVWFMEDGFLRSVGLGADLRRPSSLVIDRQGMYYDSSAPSDIIDVLNTIDLTPEQNSRALALAEIIQRQSITKYNVGCSQSPEALIAKLQADAQGREIIIVPGQFENDLSIAFSLGSIKKNIDLLAQVRDDYPQAFIIFKEHPDVYSGVRPGALGKESAKQYADLYLSDINMASLLVCADRVCTLTSLTGFEALLRHKKVTVYGSPFYAGWGLTTDKIELPQRKRSLQLSELIYGAMVQYSRYVDWNTGFITGPEQTVSFLAKQREGADKKELKSNWLSRQGRKLKYFIDSYFF